MLVTAKTIIEERTVPVTVGLNDPLHKALQLMTENDFSQLPIVDDEKKPIGLITSFSILRSLAQLDVTVKKLRVRDVVHDKPRTFGLDEDIFELLDSLRQYSAVLIINGNGVLQGLVTNWDMADYFRRRTQNMMLVEDIETHLQDHITAAFGNPKPYSKEEELFLSEIERISNSLIKSSMKESVKKYLTLLPDKHELDPTILDKVYEQLATKGKQLEDLSFNEKLELLASRWNDYGTHFPLDRDALKNLLNKIRKIRNKLAHFRSEVDSDEHTALVVCANLFKSITPLNDVAKNRNNKDFATVGTILPLNKTKSAARHYEKLANYFKQIPDDTVEQTFMFNDIEEIIQGELPPSARQHRAWWANDRVSHPQSKEWLKVGWRVVSIDMATERVVFRRSQVHSRL